MELNTRLVGKILRNISVKSICEYFWTVEKDYHLVESDRLNYRWLPFRFKFYYHITEKTNLFEKAHPFRMGIIEQINFIQKTFFNLVWKTPFFHKRSKNLLVPLQRKIKGVDIYSEELVKNLDSLMIIDSRMQSNLMKNAVSLDFYYVSVGVFAKFIATILTPFPHWHKTIDHVLDRFTYQFNLNKSTAVRMYRETRVKFICLKKLYKLLLKIKGIENVYIVGAYFRMELIAAAKELNIPVIELQHGTITKYHLGYSYPDQSNVIYFPDELWTFGEFWFEQTPIPKNVVNKIIGAPYINKLKSHKVAQDLKHNRVIINSQGVIGTKLFNFSLNVARLIPDLEVIFRLHPSEKIAKYESLLTERGDYPTNFQLSHQNPNIFELMAFSKYVAGVFSTTIYEAMYLGAQIIIINDIGVEYMEKTIERGEAVVVNSPEEFAQKYTEGKISDADYYYKN